jgi:hypothetical protein
MERFRGFKKMTALIDIPTGKIIGCKEGTLEFFHEVAHLEYSKSDKGIKLNYWQCVFNETTITFMLASLFAAIFSIFWFKFFLGLALSSWFLYQSINLYEERWCWKEARHLLRGYKAGFLELKGGKP